MKYKTYYSEVLNMIVDRIGAECTMDDAYEMLRSSISAGRVNANTRILTLVEVERRLDTDEIRSIGKRSLVELPEYAGTKTAVLTRGVWSTVGAMKASSDLAQNQTIQVFATLTRALQFLGVSRSQVEEAFPQLKDVFTGFAD